MCNYGKKQVTIICGCSRSFRGLPSSSHISVRQKSAGIWGVYAMALLAWTQR